MIGFASLERVPFVHGPQREHRHDRNADGGGDGAHDDAEPLPRGAVAGTLNVGKGKADQPAAEATDQNGDDCERSCQARGERRDASGRGVDRLGDCGIRHRSSVRTRDAVTRVFPNGPHPREVPVRDTAQMREFTVAGGLIYGRPESGVFPVLLVCNKRRNGKLDWSPPGGIVDPGEQVLEGLTREVQEETQLTVASWSPARYTVAVSFTGQDYSLKATVFEAESWAGDLHVDDPDGVVIDATFARGDEISECLALAPQWVAEPMANWLENPWENSRHYSYRVERSATGMKVDRLSP